MKFIYLFTIASLLVLGMISCNILSHSDDDNSSENFQFIPDLRFLPGELLVVLEDGYTRHDLYYSILEKYELRLRGSFPPANRISVPEGEEKKWGEFLVKEKMIRSVHLNRFGHHYTLLEEDGLPYIKNDSLYVGIAYGGCAAGHYFSLEYMKKDSSSFEIWFFKSGRQQCNLYFTENGRPFEIPDEVKDAQSIQLIKPFNDRIELRDYRFF